jgi:tetratricopeptide (TPR) repeat protein
MKLNDLNTAITKSPKEPKHYIQRASHMAKAGRTDVALANYEAAINVAPDSCDGYISRATYYLEKGEPQKAIADCSAAIERKWSTKALSIRGDAYLQIGRYDEAINDYTSAKRLDSGVAEAYFRRAQQREERGNKEGARADYEVAQQLDPGIGQ